MWQPSKLTPERMEEPRLEGSRLLREGRHHREAISGPPVVGMLRRLRSRIGEPPIVILDRAASHRSRMARDHLSWESRITNGPRLSRRQLSPEEY